MALFRIGYTSRDHSVPDGILVQLQTVGGQLDKLPAHSQRDSSLHSTHPCPALHWTYLGSKGSFYPGLVYDHPSDRATCVQCNRDFLVHCQIRSALLQKIHSQLACCQLQDKKGA